MSYRGARVKIKSSMVKLSQFAAVCTKMLHKYKRFGSKKYQTLEETYLEETFIKSFLILLKSFKIEENINMFSETPVQKNILKFGKSDNVIKNKKFLPKCLF